MSGSITRRAFFGAALAGIATFVGCSGKSSETNESGLETAVNEAPAKEIESPKQQVLEITRDNYESVLGLNVKDKKELDSRPPVVLKIYAPSCPPCRAMAPAYEEVAGSYYPGDVLFTQYNRTYNIEGQAPELPIIKEWGIAGAPKVVLVYKGEVKKMLGGGELIPIWGADGAAVFKNMVEEMLRIYCGDCSYLKRERTR